MSDEPKVFRLHYKGIRFLDARLPVDVLSDLPAFRDLLVSYAKDEWRERHIERERVPKGFDKSLTLDLVGIENGSAIPKLQWSPNKVQVNLPGFADEIEEIVDAAYANVVALIGGQSGSASKLDSDKVRALNRFGAGLREGERIEITHPSSGKVVSLDMHRRKALITGARETYQTRYESVGKLIGTLIKDENDGHVKVRTSEYGDIDIPIDPPEIKESFDGSLHQDVQFELLVELDGEDTFHRVADVFEIGVVENEYSAALSECRNRLDEIRKLEDGWRDGFGVRITQGAVKAASLFLQKRPSYCHAFRLYPTEFGGILIDFEWSGWDYSVEFNAAGHVEMYGIEISGSGQLEPQEFNDVAQEFLAAFDSRMSANG